MLRINTKLFSYDKASSEFVQELSTLLGNVRGGLGPQLIDLMVGFELQSDRTGAVVHCRFVRTEFCGTEDHEVVAWHFVSTGPVAFTVVILND